MKVTKETLIGDMLDANRIMAGILMRAGMNCVSCPSSRNETLEEACEVHGVDCDILVSQINEIFPDGI